MVEIISSISKQNTTIMVSVAAAATTIATFFSFMYLYVIYKKNKREIWKDVITSTYKEKESIMRIIKSILYLSLPMAFTSLLAASNRTIDAVTVVNNISKFMSIEQAKMQYGILTGKVESLVALPYSFNIAFATTLIPTISASNARGEMNMATKRIKFSMLLTILISLPCTAVFLVFADQILKLLFPNAYLGKTMLQMCSLSIVFVAITQTIGGVLQGLKKVKEPAIAIAVGSIAKLILNILLLPNEKLNINGAIISTIISHIVIFIITFYYLKKYINVDFNIVKFVIKPIISTAIMVIVSWFIYNNIHIFNSQNFNLVISLLVGMIVYVISIILLRVLSQEEIHMLPYINKTYRTRNLEPSKIEYYRR